MELPSEDALRWLVARYARLRAEHGDSIGDPELVEPTSRFFPDEFALDGPSVLRLLRRAMAYAPLAEDLPVDVAFLEPQEAQSGGCGSAGCGPGGGGGGPVGGLVEHGGRYRVLVGLGDVGHPVLLTSALSRGVGALVLAEAQESVEADEAGPMAEIAAVATGFGVLLLAGAALYTKSCGGLREHQGTFLTVEELAVALALFLKVHGAKPSTARAHLETTQREAFDLALRWAESNEALVFALRDHPELLVGGHFEVEPVRGLLGRLLAKRRATAMAEEMSSAPASKASRKAEGPDKRPARSAEELRRLAETRALVDEALAEGDSTS